MGAQRVFPVEGGSVTVGGVCSYCVGGRALWLESGASELLNSGLLDRLKHLGRGERQSGECSSKAKVVAQENRPSIRYTYNNLRDLGEDAEVAL